MNMSRLGRIPLHAALILLKPLTINQLTNTHLQMGKTEAIQVNHTKNEATIGRVCTCQGKPQLLVFEDQRNQIAEPFLVQETHFSESHLNIFVNRYLRNVSNLSDLCQFVEKTNLTKLGTALLKFEFGYFHVCLI